jgi:hypothetical protein
MKKYFIILIISFSFPHASSFLVGLDDIPIYKEMKYVEDSLIMFDKIDGRFVSTEISGDYKKKDVEKFYNKALPNLGWKKIDKGQYERGNEQLELDYRKNDTLLSIIFSVSPKKY